MRFFHGGPNAVDPELAAALGVSDEDKARRRKEAKDHHPLTGPNPSNLEIIDGQLMLKVPPMYWRYVQQNIGGQTVRVLDTTSLHVKWEPGSVTLSLPGIGFWVVPPGGHVDVPHEISVKIVKDSSPHLLTEAEAIHRGIAQAPATPKKVLK